MTNIKFEGVIHDISPRQLEYIASVLENREYNEVTVVVENVGKPGDNYMANVKRIKVHKDGRTFAMIAKVASSVEQLRLPMNTALLFRNEHVMYTEVLPRLTELEIAADIPKSQRLRYAECYGSFTEEPNEIILLEDLQDAGFSMLDRFKPLTDHEVRLILKSFAKLHSASYVLNHRYPAEFSMYRSKLGTIWDSDLAEQMKQYFVLMENDTLEILDKEKHKRAMKGSVSMFQDNIKKLKVDADSKYSTIVHGDSWTNNIMFRFEDDETVETCMIDYQISKCSVPANDLHYLIFNCTDYKTRAKCFHDWIDFYHSQLDDCLNNFGLKANFVYPRDQLDADMKRHAKVSLGQSAILASVLIRETEDAAKLKDSMQNDYTNEASFEKAVDSNKVSRLDENTVSKFRTRVGEVIDSFEDFGYLTVL